MQSKGSGGRWKKELGIRNLVCRIIRNPATRRGISIIQKLSFSNSLNPNSEDPINPFQILRSRGYTAKLSPHPQVRLALGF